MITRFVRLAVPAFALVVAAPERAAGQDPTPLPVSDSAEVRLDADSQAVGAVQLEPITVSASLTPLPPSQIGFTFAALDARDLAREPTLHAAEALTRLPSISLDEAAGPGGPTVLRIRGGEEVFGQILMDGVRINQNGGFFDFQGFTLTNVERVEVTRGPHSALYGSSAVSGVIQFLTRAGRPGPPRFELTSEGGGATEFGGTFQGSMSVSGGAPAFRYSTGVGLAYDRGIYDVAHNTWSRNLSLRLDATVLPELELVGMARNLDVDANLPVRDPGATRVALDPNARNERNRFVSSVTAKIFPRSTWRHDLSISVYRERFVFEDRQDGVPGPSQLGFFVFDANFTLNSLLRRVAVEYVGRKSLALGGRQRLEFSYGGRIEREDLDDETSGDFGDGMLGLDRSSRALFAEAHAAFGPVSLLAGTRLEKFEGLAAEFTPRASVVLGLVPGVFSVRAAVGRAFKAPNLQQQFLDNPFILSNPDLVAETSVSWEAGATLHTRDRRVSGGATYFRQSFDDLIRTVGIPGSNQQINRNLGRSRAQGIEAEIVVRPGGLWTAGLNGAWVSTEILENSGLSAVEYPVGAVLPFRPTFVGSGFVEVALSNRVSTRIRGTAVGSQTVLTERFSGQRVEIDSYFLLAASLTYQATAWADLYLRGENLLDHDYETAFDRRGIPATAAAGVRITR